MISAVDAHACGEPGRVIVGGVLDVPGATMFEKMKYLETRADGLRKLMLREPRGYPASNCNLILPSTNPEAAAGFVIMEQTEYPPMSGTNTICVVTVLLETGNWTDSGHPTGRRVTFTNSFAIEGHYFNFSTSGQWLWDELQIVLPPGRDPYPIVDAIQKKVLEVTGETAKQAEKEWQGVARSKDTAHTLTAAPAINVKPVVGGVEIAVRYITRANERYQMRAQLNQAAVDLLGQDLVAPPGAEATPASPTTVPASPAPKIA